MRTRHLVALVVPLAILTVGLRRPAAQAGAAAEIVVLSNRADLISGGDALVEVDLRPGVGPGFGGIHVSVDGRDVRSSFDLRPGGGFSGLVTDLKTGPNVVSVSTDTTTLATLTITNHPIGGPVFSGPQLQPWTCTTTSEPSLGPATDAQCNAPTRFRYMYRSTSGRFLPFDPGAAPPADLATVTSAAGVRLPYVVRIERGTMNRGIHEIAVLFDPSAPWTVWAPQAQWNHALVLHYGGGTSQQYRQGSSESVMDDEALSHGFMVATSSMLVNGQHANFVTAAETSVMLKEHIIETYGRLRYTIGEGGSGGALLQHLIADAYPGILDGLRPTMDWEDSISGAYREFADSGAVMHAIGASALTYTPKDRAAIGGWGGTNVTVFNTESTRVGDYNRPDDGTNCAGAESYDPATRPNGVRCTFQDFIVNLIGRRADGAANNVFDNVGVQYGLVALERGEITPDQFVDLNVHAGGYDGDGHWQAQRSSIAAAVAGVLYRTGQITQGRGLAEVAELAIRSTNNDNYHYPFRTMVNRSRLIAANGQADNHVFWIAPPSSESTLLAMDRWLAAIEADRGAGSRAAKVVRDKPADLVSACWIDGARVTDLAMCDARYPYMREPRTEAGDGPTISTMKCQLTPMVRSAYHVTFTDAQWTALQRTFPTGVCDYSRPGVGVQPTMAWLSYSSGPGGQPMGAAPASAAR